MYGGENMEVLPRYDEAVIPKEKFVNYALDHDSDPDKATAFNLALGYDKTNAYNLISSIKQNLSNYNAIKKGDDGHGMKYEVAMSLTGPNGKTAKVITAWIDDNSNGQMRLITAYVDK